MGDDPPFDEPVAVPIEDALDLHSFAPRDIPDVVREYVASATAKGFREVRLIHGKGIGVQRARVRRVLATLPEVVHVADAPPERGGVGATLVTLSPVASPPPLP